MQFVKTKEWWMRRADKEAGSDVSAGVPNPGSALAIVLGCTCAIRENNQGDGWWAGNQFFMLTTDCPLHDLKPTPEQAS